MSAAKTTADPDAETETDSDSDGAFKWCLYEDFEGSYEQFREHNMRGHQVRVQCGRTCQSLNGSSCRTSWFGVTGSGGSLLWV